MVSQWHPRHAAPRRKQQKGPPKEIGGRCRGNCCGAIYGSPEKTQAPCPLA
ncbi:hypothetical protein [Azospirillum endophyticum]